jgi:hypothetical protein
MKKVNRNFARYRYSATLFTSDAAVLHCLRGLSHWAQRGEPHQQIAWGGCGEKDWQNRGGHVTFRFTSPDRRALWRAKSDELFSGKWSLINTHDDDPAIPPNRGLPRSVPAVYESFRAPQGNSRRDVTRIDTLQWCPTLKAE